MCNTYLVCCKCGGDHLSMVADHHARMGYDTHCWDCKVPSNKVEVPFPADDEPNAVQLVHSWGNKAMPFDILRAAGRIKGIGPSERESFKQSPFNHSNWVDGKFIGGK